MVDFHTSRFYIGCMKKRFIESNILAALKDTPVVFINGARQTGKSTLTQALLSGSLNYVTLDDVTTLSAVKSDPTAFLHSLQSPVVIDEIQRAPELFLPLKLEVDQNRKPGRYILTGSVNVLLLPKLADSLAGRMEIITLWQFSQGEIEGRKETFVERVLAKKFSYSKNNTTISRSNLLERIISGGYPEVQTRDTDTRKQAWFGSYLTTIIQRDIRDITRIEGLTAMPKLLSLLAARSSTLLNFAELSNSAAIPQTTLKRYLSLLEATYLIQLTPAWSTNRGKIFIKTPKIVLTDTGALTYLLGTNKEMLSTSPTMFGPVLENFVVMELKKQCGWNELRPSVFHFRTLRGEEVDIVLESRAGFIVGIEVKAASSVTESDFKNLKLLMKEARSKFVRGIILYSGSQVIPFADNLYAIPISELWNG